MRYAEITERLGPLGGAKWEVHITARQRAAKGEDILFLTIGEPDASPPPEVIAAAVRCGSHSDESIGNSTALLTPMLAA